MKAVVATRQNADFKQHLLLLLHYSHHHINSDVWLIKPQAGLSTPLVFKHMDYNELSKEDPRKLLENFHKKVRFHCKHHHYIIITSSRQCAKTRYVALVKVFCSEAHTATAVRACYSCAHTI
eukprot:12214-Heterococcus_DN1.PRE.2